MELYICYFTNFFSLIQRLNDSGILDLFAMVLSTIIPLLIMIVTIKHEKKTANADAAEREKQFKKTIEITNQHHKEQLETQEEINRIAIMPYLTIENVSGQIERGSKSVDFLISFKNIGNGTAINLTVKYLEPNTSSNIIYQTEQATYCCTKPFDDYSSVARPDDLCEIKITQRFNGSISQNFGLVCITVIYSDMKQHHYEQPFSIIFNADSYNDVRILHKTVNNPELK